MFSSRSILRILILIVMAVGLCRAEDYVIVDGESAKSDLDRANGGPYYEKWWGGKDANTLVESADAPFAGKRCLLWTCNEDWTGGSLMVDPSWVGANVETLTNLEFMARGAKGGESMTLVLFDRSLGQPGEGDGFFNTVELKDLTASWKKFSFSYSDLTKGREKKRPLDTTMFEGIQFAGARKGTAVYFDDLKFGMKPRQEIVYSPVKYNHIGYRPADRKVAILNRKVDRFSIVEAVSKKTVFTGKPVLVSEFDPDSGDLIGYADFSGVTNTGRYRIELPDGTKSGDFDIAKDVYRKPLIDMIRTYYYQRCGIGLDPKYAGKWPRERCHTNDVRAGFAKGNDGKVQPGTADERFGWHDAGDDNKYSWNYDMMWLLADLYAHLPGRFPDGDLNIPESGNGRSDLLDELVFETKWYVKMQVASGREAGLAFEQIRQIDDQGKRPYLQFTRKLLAPRSDSTANYCQSMAMMAWVLSREKDQESRDLAALCRTGAVKAWSAYEKFTRGGKVSYPAGKRIVFDADRFKAAVEMFRMTGEKKYHDIVKSGLDGYIADYRAGDKYWGQNKFNPFFTYCEMPASATDPAVVEKMKSVVRAYRILNDGYATNNGYRVPFGNVGHFCWGSNGHLSANGVIFYHLFLWDGLDVDLQKVKRIADYLLGENAVDKVMLTGWGKALIYHGIWAKTKDPDSVPPGYVPGGVNMHNDNEWMSRYPQKRYRDTTSNWTVNEVSTGYQAAAVYILSLFVP